MRRAVETPRPCIIATLESVNPLPLRHRDGKRVADWNMIHWGGLSESSDHIMRLASTILNIDADDLYKELFSKDEEKYAKVGIDIILARQENLSHEATTRLNEAIRKYLFIIHPSPDQTSASLLPEADDTTCDLSAVKKIAEEFLSHHGTKAGKRAVIKTPYLVQFADQVAQVSGSYGPKPLTQTPPQGMRTTEGTVDSICLSDRSLGILLTNSKKILLTFDEATQFIEIKKLLGDRRFYEFCIMDEVDAKGRSVSRLVRVVKNVGLPLPLFNDE